MIHWWLILNNAIYKSNLSSVKVAKKNWNQKFMTSKYFVSEEFFCYLVLKTLDGGNNRMQARMLI